MFESIVKYSEFSCGIVLLLFALIQIIYRHRNFLNYNLAGLYFCISYVILTFWAFKSSAILYAPWLIFTDIATAFAIGPFVYFYIKTVLGITTRSYLKYFIHFIPSFAVFLSIIGYNIFDGSSVRYYLHFTGEYPPYSISRFIQTIDIISSLYLLLYFTITIKKIYALLKNKAHRSMKELKVVFYYMLVVLLLSFMMLIANITHSDILNITAIYLLTFTGIWYFVFSFRYPEFTQKAIKEARVIRYENSLLSGIDSETVLGRLDELMEDEKIFIDEELTLQKLSSLLMITPHQLSKILNSKRKMNFRALINSYRIKEAMKQMAEHPDKTILEIALASGFNSKSSFNSVFMKSSGITPSDYRTGLKK